MTPYAPKQNAIGGPQRDRITKALMNIQQPPPATPMPPPTQTGLGGMPGGAMPPAAAKPPMPMPAPMAAGVPAMPGAAAPPVMGMPAAQMPGAVPNATPQLGGQQPPGLGGY